MQRYTVDAVAESDAELVALAKHLGWDPMTIRRDSVRIELSGSDARITAECDAFIDIDTLRRVMGWPGAAG